MNSTTTNSHLVAAVEGSTRLAQVIAEHCHLSQDEAESIAAETWDTGGSNFETITRLHGRRGRKVEPRVIRWYTKRDGRTYTLYRRLQPLGPDATPHCRAHLQFRSDCERCVSERGSA